MSVNGTRLASDASKFNLSQTAMESGVLTQVINFQYNFVDEGFYVYSLYFSRLYYLFRVGGEIHGYQCQENYAGLYLRLRPISFVIFPYILTTYSE